MDLIVLPFMILYLAIAIGVSILTWRLTRRIEGAVLRIGLNATVVALLFAPSFFSCSDFIAVPFAMTVAIDISEFASGTVENGCGKYFVIPNLPSFVATLVVVAAILAVQRRQG